MTTLSQQILMSLPPVEAKEVTSAMESFPGYQSSDLQAWKERQCLPDAVTNSKHPMAQALLVELQKHSDQHYDSGTKSGTVQARHAVTEDSETVLQIRTYAQRLEPHKFLSGYWATQALYDTATHTLTGGTISMHVQYDEDGSNVHFQATRELDAKETEDATVVVQQLVQQTAALHTDLVQMADDALQGSLKKVRRILPITKTRMKWDDAAQQQVRLLNKKKKDGEKQ